MRKEISFILIFALCCSFWMACGKEQENMGKVKIGLIYDIGGRGDKSFCDASYEGLQRAAKEFGFEPKEITPSQTTDLEIVLRKLAEEKYDLIIGVGLLFQEPMKRVAADFPDVNFAIIDVSVPAPNVASLIFEAHEGAYLVGAIAGLKTETNKLGFVGGMDIPLIQAFEAGYRAGALAVNSDVVVFANYAGVTPQAFVDPTKGKELALAQYSKGVDIIFQASGSTGLGVLEAARENQKYIIWVDSNGNHLAPGLVLTSMLKRVDVAVYETIKSVVKGQFTGGDKIFGLKEEGVGYATDEHNQPLLSKEIMDKVESLREQIIAGEIVVPLER